MANVLHFLSKQTITQLSDKELAGIAGHVVAQQFLDYVGIPLSDWRDQHLAQFEKAVAGYDDAPAQLGAWVAGFDHAVMSAIRGKGGEHAD